MVLILGEIRSLNVGDLAIANTAKNMYKFSRVYSFSPDNNKVCAKLLGFNIWNFIYTFYLVVIVCFLRPEKVVLPGGQIIRNNLHWAIRCYILSKCSSNLSFERVGVDDLFSKKTSWFWTKVFKQRVRISCRDQESIINLNNNFGVNAPLDKDTAYRMTYPTKEYEVSNMCASFMGYSEFTRHKKMSEEEFLKIHRDLASTLQVKSLLCSSLEDYNYWKIRKESWQTLFFDNHGDYINELKNYRGILSSRMHPLIFGECMSMELHVLAISNKLSGYYNEVKSDGVSKISCYTLQQ